MNAPAYYDTRKLKSCGTDVRISANVMIRRPELVSIGNHVAIDDGFYCTTALEIGDYVHIAPYTTIIGGSAARCVIKNFGGVAAGCRLICASEELKGAGLVGPLIPDRYHDKLVVAPIIIEKFATLGTNVVVMPGVTLGEGAQATVSAVVTRNLDPWGVYVGIPARKVGERPSQKMKAYAREMGYV